MTSYSGTSLEMIVKMDYLFGNSFLRVGDVFVSLLSCIDIGIEKYGRRQLIVGESL